MRRPADVWDAEYAAGRYAGEPPLAFVRTILAELDRRPNVRRLRGLYVGCGNGRNYVPLAAGGLDIVGLDVSREGLRQVASKEPSLAANLVCGDFLEYGGRFGYIVSIQSFQHGAQSVSERYFRRAGAMLAPGGLLFVRVNGASTEIAHPHDILEESDAGFTALYLAGPKRGLHVRFFTKVGLERVVAESGLLMASGPSSVAARRTGRDGSWVQWEMVAVKEAA